VACDHVLTVSGDTTAFSEMDTSVAQTGQPRPAQQSIVITGTYRMPDRFECVAIGVYTGCYTKPDRRVNPMNVRVWNRYLQL